MKKSLVIVESPAKIKTLRKFLGPNFIFESSLGHIRDLPAKDFGIDLENNFEPNYVTLPEKKQVIQNLQKAAKEVDTVYLSPDPDREGEAIAWHISQILPEDTNIKRVAFNSITKEAVQKAIESPRSINQALVNAQQARRLLDRIVGYKISPILNRRIQRGREGSVSAGRVQSVALKLVVDREVEIEAFKPVEYWNITALLDGDEEKKVSAYLFSIDGKKVEKEPIEGKDVALVPNQTIAEEIVKDLKAGSYVVTRVDKKERRRNPEPPFITSTLQQEASRHHGFSSSKTMSVAQTLYEGIDLGNEGPEGLITYMRTDSVRIAPEALAEARTYIQREYGAELLPDKPRPFSTKKATQDAHEAIRPTNLAHPPEAVSAFLSKDQFRLYTLIWKRFLASQMAQAIYDTVSCDIMCTDKYLLRATGSILKFSGFLTLYEEKRDDDAADEDRGTLPDLKEGQDLNLIDITHEQAFTRPPPRYTEASLVKELEKSGIGRPSTYATIMNKIQSRDYTVKENRRLKPTELGRVIAAMLETNFQQIMDIGFTAQMEDDLEQIAESDKDWRGLIADFWKDFLPTIETAEKEAFVPKILTDHECPKCSSQLQKVWYRDRYFFGCSKYPDCDYSAPLEEVYFNKEDYAEDFDWDQSCPLCTKPMKIRYGRYGAFLGCTAYPDCKGIVNIPKKGEEVIAQQDLPSCPAIGCDGTLVARKSRFGKTFFSCSTFPDCDVIVGDLEQISTKYPNHPKTAYVKKTKGKKKGAKSKKAEPKKAKAKTKAKTKRVAPVFELSSELSEFVGESTMSRGEVTRKIWEYIKANDLQDPENKRTIRPDTKLGVILGTSEPIDMFQMTKHVSKHIKDRVKKSEK